jgi:hypothetical protein
MLINIRVRAGFMFSGNVFIITLQNVCVIYKKENLTKFWEMENSPHFL